MAMAVEEMGQAPDNRSGTRTKNIIGQLEMFARSGNNHQPNSWALKIVSVVSVSTRAQKFRRPNARM